MAKQAHTGGTRPKYAVTENPTNKGHESYVASVIEGNKPTEENLNELAIVEPQEIVLLPNGSYDITSKTLTSEETALLTEYEKKYDEIATVTQQVKELEKKVGLSEKFKSIRILENVTETVTKTTKALSEININKFLKAAMEQALETGNFIEFSAIYKNLCVGNGILMDKRNIEKGNFDNNFKQSKVEIKVNNMFLSQLNNNINNKD